LDQDQKPGKLSTVQLFLLAGYGLFSLNGWLRMIGSITHWDLLVLSNLSPGPVYLLLSGFLWGVVGLAALAWIARRRPYFRLVGLAAAGIFILTYWVDRLVVRNPETSLPNVLFAVLFTLLAVVYVLLALRPLGELKTMFSGAGRR
jgi:hypothetical protein